MKFTNGYWMTKPEYRINYATQCVRAEALEDTLRLLTACRPVKGRGDVLNGATLQVTLSAPRKNIIRVQVTHFAGEKDNGPHFETYSEKTQPVIQIGKDAAVFQNGDLTARALIQEGEWRLDFLNAEGEVLTSSGYHGMGRALLEEAGPCSLERHGISYMSDSLELAVGETVYGLGERFTAYVKNGQRVDMWNADGGTASELAYKNIPFYMTNCGYGVFVEDSSEVSFEVASEKVERVQFSVPGETLVYDVIYGGNPKATLDLYTALPRPKSKLQYESKQNGRFGARFLFLQHDEKAMSRHRSATR